MSYVSDKYYYQKHRSNIVTDDNLESLLDLQ
jgi:hypothetical protein